MRCRVVGLFFATYQRQQSRIKEESLSYGILMLPYGRSYHMESIFYIRKTKEFVSQHLTDDFSLSQVAEYVGYSAFHLARVFKTTTGISIMEYARDQRIFAASKELEKNRNVSDVAVTYCFDTHAGFTKAFVRAFGCTPKEFQAHVQSKQACRKDIGSMDISQIKVRFVCKDDVQDL